MPYFMLSRIAFSEYEEWVVSLIFHGLTMVPCLCERGPHQCLPVGQQDGPLSSFGPYAPGGPV
jgi:hypothetical protein